ncbi:Cell surface protein [Weissella jogaejeotgali]|uniref:Cell surface protein n=1 Tax=Weissella jogaejeotgali TaxID=1631871 RepID=A0A1L6RE99_9LACO|nr:NEAT domain-containing protein [Weissella jogaejeotgali]APS42865.1 Cell surface protein [Weissella jogaejeotgali]
MTNKKYLRYLLSTFALLLFMFGIQLQIHAESYNVPMQVLENGSSNTSYAAAYFAKSATVTPTGNGSYNVTSSVTTQKDLGNYPVQILNIDGAGANVSRSDSGDSQTITYSFTTTDLKARHNAAIKVDVNSINYHHNYVVGLSLDASAVPAASSSSSSASSQSASSSSQAASSQATSSTEIASSSSVTEASQSSEPAASSSETNKSATSKSSQKATKQVAKETHQDKDKQLPVAAIVGGGLAIGIILGLVINLKKK